MSGDRRIKGRECSDVLHIVAAGVLLEAAHGHVFDHAAFEPPDWRAGWLLIKDAAGSDQTKSRMRHRARKDAHGQFGCRPSGAARNFCRHPKLRAGLVTRSAGIDGCHSLARRRAGRRRRGAAAWPVLVLGHRLSGLVAIQPGHELVMSGVYRVIRHPSYLGLVVNSLGWALAFRSGVGVLLTALLIPPLLARIHAEERLLRAQFGSEYDAYCSRTSRLLPGLY
jgi:hypothetical protein